MRRFIIIGLAAVSIGSMVTGCATSSLMELNACNCFTLRRGVTPEQFEGPDSKTHSWLGPSHKPQPESSQKVQLGEDVWEVWVYRFESEYQDTHGSWESESPENMANDSGARSVESSHQEYVAFRNGLLEAWGKGSLPAALKGKTNDAPSRRSDGR